MGSRGVGVSGVGEVEGSRFRGRGAIGEVGDNREREKINKRGNHM